jgi:hypothetical protein
VAAHTGQLPADIMEDAELVKELPPVSKGSKESLDKLAAI